MTTYWIKFSDGSIVTGLKVEDFRKPENQDRSGRIIITWGVER